MGTICKTALKEAKVDKKWVKKRCPPQMQRRKSFFSDPKMIILEKSIILNTKNAKLLGRKQKWVQKGGQKGIGVGEPGFEGFAIELTCMT